MSYSIRYSITVKPVRPLCSGSSQITLRLGFFHRDVVDLLNSSLPVVKVIDDNAHLSVSLLGLRKQAINILQRKALGFWEEKVNYRNPGGIQNLEKESEP